jgi:hypothetical protein
VQVQGTVVAERGVRALTGLRALRCLALEVYHNMALDGLACLSVVTQLTQLQARALCMYV